MGLQIKLRYLYDLIGGDHPFDDVYEDTISDKLIATAIVAGVYDVLWMPHRLDKNWSDSMSRKDSLAFEKASRVKARDLIIPLSKGLVFLKWYNEEPGDVLVDVHSDSYMLQRQVERYLEACTKDPEAIVFVKR